MVAPAQRFYITGGTLPSYALSYIVRQADTALLQGLQAGEFCYVLNTRQIGKSSLMVRTAQQLRAEGHLVALLDLTAIGQNVTVEAWYDGLLTLLAEQIRMSDELEEFWLEYEWLGPMQRWMEAIRRVVLAERPQRLFLFIDEIDAVRSLPFSTDEFFTGIRECYNRRGWDESFNRLTFCLLGVATPADLISDTRMSPFNIGQRILLSDFTLEEVAPLALGLQGTVQHASGALLPPTNPPDPAVLQQSRLILARILYWTNGHPYLTQRLCQALSQSPPPLHVGDVDRLCQELFLVPEAQNTDDNMAFVRNSLLRGGTDVAALLDLYRQVCLGRPVRNDLTHPLHVALRLSGIVRVEKGDLRVRNRIYARVFNLEWVLANMPDAELRRQRAAYRRGMARAAAVFGSLAALITALLLVTVFYANHARAAEERASHALYISDINLMQREWENSNIAYVLELMDETRRSAEKGIEWDYWNRQTHQSLHTLAMPDRMVGVAIVPGQKQAVVLSKHGLLKLWDLETGQVRRTLAIPMNGAGEMHTILCSPDGTKLLIGCKDIIQIRDAVSWRLLQKLQSSRGDIVAAAMSPDQTQVAAVTDGHSACTWNVATGAMTHEYKPTRGEDQDGIFNVAFTGGHLALFRRNGVMEVHDIATGQEKDKSRLNLNIMAGGIAFSRDGTRLVGRDRKGNINIWETQSGKIMQILDNDSDLHSVHFSQDERLLFTVQGTTVNVWDVQAGRLLRTFREHIEAVQAVAGTSDNRYVVSAAYDDLVKVWDLNLPANPLTLHVSKQSLWHVAYSPDGTQIATGSDDGLATLWDATTGHKIQTIPAGKTSVIASCFRMMANDCSPETEAAWDACGTWRRDISSNDSSGIVARSIARPFHPMIGMCSPAAMTIRRFNGM